MLYNLLIGFSGFSEVSGQAPNQAQWKIIQDHLNLVFNKVTPNRIENNQLIKDLIDAARNKDSSSPPPVGIFPSPSQPAYFPNKDGLPNPLTITC